jgi:hypothetical protein
MPQSRKCLTLKWFALLLNAGIASGALAQSSTLPACEDSAPCWQRALLHSVEQGELKDQALELQRKDLAIKGQMLEVTTANLQQASSVINVQQAALVKSADVLKPRWYDSPVLWFAVGVVTTGVVIGVTLYAAPRLMPSR